MSRRGDISNATLSALSVAVALAIPCWFVLRNDLPGAFQEPGTPLLQGVAIAGAMLLLVPLVYALAKRSPHTRTPALWLSVHAVAALVGTALVTIHAAGRMLEPPALLLLNLVVLMAIGLWARVRGARRMADTFATKQSGFAAPSPDTRARLRGLIQEKRRLLAALDPAAEEATFSPTPGHWLSRPGLTRRYVRLAREEARVMGQRASVPAAQAWWRVVHLALAGVFVAGLAVHVILVTFFAGWVADGGDVYWWHLARWGG